MSVSSRESGCLFPGRVHHRHACDEKVQIPQAVKVPSSLSIPGRQRPRRLSCEPLGATLRACFCLTTADREPPRCRADHPGPEHHGAARLAAAVLAGLRRGPHGGWIASWHSRAGRADAKSSASAHPVNICAGPCIQQIPQGLVRFGAPAMPPYLVAVQCAQGKHK